MKKTGTVAILLRTPKDVEKWLRAKVKAKGRGNRQDVILDLLTDAMKAEQTAKAAVA